MVNSKFTAIGILHVSFLLIVCFSTNSSAIADSLYYVATDGSDSNIGSKDEPFLTLQHAINTAKKHDTIVAMPGVYREGNINVSKPVTIRALVPGEVLVKGSVDISNGWYKNGRYWSYDGWKKQYCRPEEKKKRIWQIDFCTTFPIDRELNAYAHYPDMLFFDGVPLVQVSGEHEFDENLYGRPEYSGEFFVDQANNRITVNINPKGKLIESAAFDYGIKLEPGSKGSVLDGIGLSHVGSTANWSSGEQAALYVSTDNITVKNSTIEWNASYGVFINPPLNSKNPRITGEAIVFENNTIQFNGKNGLLAREVHRGSLFKNNKFLNNNVERWDINSKTISIDDKDGTVPSTTVAAVKIGAFSSDHIWADNLFEGNYSHGWWCDVGCTNISFVGNVVANNQLAGVFYEISSNGTIANNIISRNGTGGIWLVEANNVKVYNNLLEDNHISNFWFLEGSRYISPERFNNSEFELEKFDANNVTFKLSGLDVGNNIISSDSANGTYDDGKNHGKHVWWSILYRAGNTGDPNANSEHHTEGFNAKFEYFDCNATYRTDVSAPDTLIDWYGNGEFGSVPDGRYDDFSSFNTEQGNKFQSKALLVQGVSPQPFYTLDRSTWKFSLNERRLVGCKTTPTEVTNVLGIADGYNLAGPVVDTVTRGSLVK